MSKEGGLKFELQQAVDTGLSWVDVGVVEEVEDHPRYGMLLMVRVQPAGRLIQSRVLRLGAHASGGFHWPVAVGDQVLVLSPAGDPNRSVALPGLATALQPPPTTATQDHADLVHPGGLEVRTAAAQDVQPVLLAADFQADLEEVMGALVTFAAAVAAAAAVPATPVTTGTLAGFLGDLGVKAGLLKAKLGAEVFSSGAVRTS